MAACALRYYSNAGQAFTARTSVVVSHFLPLQLLHQHSAHDFVLEVHSELYLCVTGKHNDSVFTPVVRYTEFIEDSVQNVSYQLFECSRGLILRRLNTFYMTGLPHFYKFQHILRI